jgi:hypothetical protein
VERKDRAHLARKWVQVSLKLNKDENAQGKRDPRARQCRGDASQPVMVTGWSTVEVSTPR